MARTHIIASMDRPARMSYHIQGISILDLGHTIVRRGQHNNMIIRIASEQSHCMISEIKTSRRRRNDSIESIAVQGSVKVARRFNLQSGAKIERIFSNEVVDHANNFMDDI